MIDESLVHGFRFLCYSCLEVDKVTITTKDGMETITCECGNTEKRSVDWKEKYDG